MVRVRCLERASLPPGALTQPSPASLQSNRLALHVFESQSCYLYFASGTSIYQAKVSLGDRAVVQGKDSLLIPKDVEKVPINQLSFSPHRAEIQSVSVSEQTCEGNILLGSVDSCGRIVVSCLGETQKGLTYMASPQDAGSSERGWAGLAFAPGEPSFVAVARGFNKSIDFYDADLHLRTFHTLQPPTAMAFLDGYSDIKGRSLILAVTEGPQISIWDLRAGEKCGCMQRMFGSSSLEPLYAVCSSPGGLVGTGGAERTAVIFDARKWTAISRWTSCLKYEIMGLSFSAVDENAIYVHGLDNEVVCGRWSGRDDANRQFFTFRGDSRWLGFSKSLRSDCLAGWCESGSIFIGEAVA